MDLDRHDISAIAGGRYYRKKKKWAILFAISFMVMLYTFFMAEDLTIDFIEYPTWESEGGQVVVMEPYQVTLDGEVLDEVNPAKLTTTYQVMRGISGFAAVLALLVIIIYWWKENKVRSKAVDEWIESIRKGS